MSAVLSLSPSSSPSQSSPYTKRKATPFHLSSLPPSLSRVRVYRARNSSSSEKFPCFYNSGAQFGSVPPGCTRACLIAVTSASENDPLCVGSEDIKVGGFEGKFSFNKGSVAGILTIDTVADFLPRKGPFRQRRTGIAYIANVAVRETDRRKGIAKMLIAKAGAKARSWGCRSVALHCDANNLAAVRLYKGQGFKNVKAPKQAKWPHPKTSPGVQFDFMMKLLSPSRTT